MGCNAAGTQGRQLAKRSINKDPGKEKCLVPFTKICLSNYLQTLSNSRSECTHYYPELMNRECTGSGI